MGWRWPSLPTQILVLSAYWTLLTLPDLLASVLRSLSDLESISAAISLLSFQDLLQLEIRLSTDTLPKIISEVFTRKQIREINYSVGKVAEKCKPSLFSLWSGPWSKHCSELPQAVNQVLIEKFLCVLFTVISQIINIFFLNSTFLVLLPHPSLIPLFLHGFINILIIFIALSKAATPQSHFYGNIS